MASVLLVGYIPYFLQERERTFLTAGYEVAVASSFAAASNAIEQGLFDVAVLGFSVPEKERNELARALKEANAAIQIVMLYFDSVENTELADALMQTNASAEEIVRAVNHLLNEQNRSRAG